MKLRDHAEAGVAHPFQRVLVADLALAENTGFLRIDAEIDQRLDERGRLGAAGYEYEHRLRVEVLRTLHEREEIGVRDRHAHRAEKLAAGVLERPLECALGVDSGAV